MKRLTGYDFIAGVKTGDLLAGVEPQKAYDRLAAYEDTGLEPEEIKALVAEYKNMLSTGRTCTAFRLRELAQADREGRVVVLPCKVGDTVHFKTYKKNATICVGVQPHTVHGIRTYCLVEGEYADVGLSVDQFGKTIFLTREEAEAALGAQKE